MDDSDSDESDSRETAYAPRSNWKRNHDINWNTEHSLPPGLLINRLSAQGQQPEDRGLSSYTIDFKTLKEWATLHHNPDKLIQLMIEKLDRIKNALGKGELSCDCIHFFALSFQKIIREKSKLSNRIMELVAHSNFLDGHIPKFMSTIHNHPHIMPVLYKSVQAFLDILDYIAIRFSDCSNKCFVCVCKIEEFGVRFHILTGENDLSNRCSQLKMKSCPIPLTDGVEHSDSSLKRRREKAVPIRDEESPPDDFTKKSIFPDIDELETATAPFLRANKTTGPYRDLHHYTDVHFRLLREDYLSPLREGIKAYKNLQYNEQNMNSKDLRFYVNSQLVKLRINDNDGIHFLVKFDLEGLSDIKWEFSKRLLFGSLLCFSKDDFKSVMFATVINRDAKNLENGLVEVIFQSNLEQVLISSESDTFVIAETVSFFESYKHVLEGLQEVSELPLDESILYCNPKPDPPMYLTASTSYDLGCIMNEDEHNYVKILNPSEWPKHENTVLNAAQLEAVKLALTNEVAIIQGPPGTGKTYVGLHIMELLLNNQTHKPKDQAPILVVCYTNHALDQFLEGIIEFCHGGIIRVGGRSSSEKLKDFNLRELRKNPRMDKRLKRSINDDLRECKKRLKKVSFLIKQSWQESLNLDTNIQKVNSFEEEITEKQYFSLTDPSRGGGSGKEINIWLKASNANIENHLMKAAEKNLIKLILSDDEETLLDSYLLSFSNVRIPFEYRVKIYRGLVNKYKKDKEETLSQLLGTSNPAQRQNVHQIEALMKAIDSADNDILPDEDLLPYVSNQEVFEKIKLCVQQECKKEESPYIKPWLLGCFKKVEEILDEIEKLSRNRFATKSGQPTASKTFADRKEYHDRVVIDDDDDTIECVDDMAGFKDCESDESDDDTDDRSSNGSQASKMVEDYKNLFVNYKESERREDTLLQRAKMLHIDMAEEENEENEEDAFSWQTSNQMNYSQVFKLIRKARPLTEEEAEKIDDVWNLSLPKRYSLYKFWMLRKKRKIAQEIILLTNVYNQFVRLKKRALSRKDIAILKKSQVIGMTTTGAARYREVLQDVKPRIIIVEEAAEVLEAHIVTTLNKHCEHLILIGDHQQLRPNPTVHTLAVDYDLEISLFERLVKNNVRHITLQIQHRMSQQISRYLRNIYPNLRDHSTVLSYDNVKGVGSNVFFLSHSYRESDIRDTMSKSNFHEAKFLTKLCKYFLQQGYQGSQITILAAYSGQVAVLRECMEPEEDLYMYVRVTSIDNYQGEENDIVLLSLVRSNLDQDVGFLKVSNRVCVALSRARQGLFVIGNMTQLEGTSNLWRKILGKARKNNEVGIALKVVCMNHTQHTNFIQHAEDFATKVPEGGCDQTCGYKLFCGHICTRKCHISDPMHNEVECQEPCEKACPQGHLCPKKCCEECEQCEILVEKKMLFCGHKDFIQCYLDPCDGICKQPCKQSLSCGHLCQGLCGECRRNDVHQECQEPVEKTWKLCGDRSLVPCFTDTKTSPCPAKCREKLRCGDFCKSTCGGCLSKRVHKSCGAKCKKALPCGHQCQSKCSMPCESCKIRCPTKCRHISCSKNCGEICDVCMENCAFTCKHRQCFERCGDECKQNPCGQRCKQPLKCKHGCSSICGENCVCFICDEKHFSLIDFAKSKPGNIVFADVERAKKFEPDKETIFMKIPNCGHVFTLKQLDQHVNNFDPNGTSYIRCPRCLTTIQGIIRYDKLNKERSYKRENRKHQLEQLCYVSEDTLEELRYSLNIMEKFCSFDLDNYMKHRDQNVRKSHADALRLLSRYAFILYSLMEIHKEFNDELPFNPEKWKESLRSNQEGITLQYEKEMAMELHRLLILEQFVSCKKLLDKSDLTMTEPLKNQYKLFVKRDLHQKLTSKVKTESELFLSELYKLLTSPDVNGDTKMDAENLAKKTLLTKNILDKPGDLELHAILDTENISLVPIEGEPSSEESSEQALNSCEESDEDL